MYPEALVFGIVDRPSPQGDAALASELRDLTISWSRYDYRGRILVGETIDSVLDQALELGYRWCLVQRAGNIILERWDADEDRRRFDQCVSHWIGERDFLALAAAGDDCLLVDVPRWEELGRPDIRRPFVDAPRESSQDHCLSLGRLSPARRTEHF